MFALWLAQWCASSSVRGTRPAAAPDVSTCAAAAFTTAGAALASPPRVSLPPSTSEHSASIASSTMGAPPHLSSPGPPSAALRRARLAAACRRTSALQCTDATISSGSRCGTARRGSPPSSVALPSCTAHSATAAASRCAVLSWSLGESPATATAAPASLPASTAHRSTARGSRAASLSAPLVVAAAAVARSRAPRAATARCWASAHRMCRSAPSRSKPAAVSTPSAAGTEANAPPTLALVVLMRAQDATRLAHGVSAAAREHAAARFVEGVAQPSLSADLVDLSAHAFAYFAATAPSDCLAVLAVSAHLSQQRGAICGNLRFGVSRRRCTRGSGRRALRMGQADAIACPC
eukprot:7390672-Prymnesium_polylepis.1